MPNGTPCPARGPSTATDDHRSLWRVRLDDPRNRKGTANHQAFRGYHLDLFALVSQIAAGEAVRFLTLQRQRGTSPHHLQKPLERVLQAAMMHFIGHHQGAVARQRGDVNGRRVDVSAGGSSWAMASHPDTSAKTCSADSRTP